MSTKATRTAALNAETIMRATEDVLREVLLPKGWVDVKVCAVDAIYSGLHFRKRRT